MISLNTRHILRSPAPAPPLTPKQVTEGRRRIIAARDKAVAAEQATLPAIKGRADAAAARLAHARAELVAAERDLRAVQAESSRVAARITAIESDARQQLQSEPLNADLVRIIEARKHLFDMRTSLCGRTSSMCQAGIAPCVQAIPGALEQLESLRWSAYDSLDDELERVFSTIPLHLISGGLDRV